MSEEYTVKTPLKNFLLTYIVLKFLFVIFAYYINGSLLGNINFDFGDFWDYHGCEMRSYNTFYSYTICLLGINAISNKYIMFLSFFLSSIRDICYIYITSNILSKNYLLLFIVLIAIHPYLALYHPRFVTGLFGSFGFLLIFWIIVKDIKLNPLLIFVFVILTGFRNALMPAFIAFIVLDGWKNRKEFTFRKFTLYFLSIALIYLITKIPEQDYAYEFMIENEYAFSWFNTIRFMSLEQNFFSYIISLPVVFISNLVLLLGFREAVYTSGFQIFSDFNFGDIFQIIVFSTLFIFHSLGLLGLYMNIKTKDIRFLCFLAYFFPSMLFVAHMRYFIPMIPLAILGFVYFIRQFNDPYKK